MKERASLNTPQYSSIKIGSLEVPGNIFLAPLAGYTDRAFRSICISYGAVMAFSEMVSAEAVARGSEKTEALMLRDPNEPFSAIQIFLSRPDQAERALPRILQMNPDIIDINCGCPVPKIVRNGAGSALMRSPETIEDIVRTLSSRSKVPITVKIRSGWDNDHINFLDAARAAENGGASMITMHPRTRTQGYSGKANWHFLQELKQAVSIPVIGSGDAVSPETAVSMLQQTGVDGLMIGRGAIGNPWIFMQTASFLKTGTAVSRPSFSEMYSVIMQHLDLTIAYKGEERACKEMRKHICAYTKGLPASASLRNELVHASDRKTYDILLKDFFRTSSLS